MLQPFDKRTRALCTGMLKDAERSKDTFKDAFKCCHRIVLAWPGLQLHAYWEAIRGQADWDAQPWDARGTVDHGRTSQDIVTAHQLACSTQSKERLT